MGNHGASARIQRCRQVLLLLHKHQIARRRRFDAGHAAHSNAAIPTYASTHCLCDVSQQSRYHLRFLSSRADFLGLARAAHESQCIAARRWEGRAQQFRPGGNRSNGLESIWERLGTTLGSGNCAGRVVLTHDEVALNGRRRVAAHGLVCRGAAA